MSNLFEILYRSYRYQSILAQYLKDLLVKLTQLMKNRWLTIQREMILSAQDLTKDGKDGAVNLQENFYSNECGTYMIVLKILNTCIKKHPSITLQTTKDILCKISELWNTMDDDIKTWFTEFQRTTVDSFKENVKQVVSHDSH